VFLKNQIEIILSGASGRLAVCPDKAENGAVRIWARSAATAAIMLALLGAYMAAVAQYQDRDTRGVPKTSANAPSPEARIDINHATVNELLKIPGMTPSWAGRIVRFRPYRAKDDLLERGVITSTVYGRIKDYVIAHRNPQ
jgi:DNA uptake protein ComE-like DNA-binding protein